MKVKHDRTPTARDATRLAGIDAVIREILCDGAEHTRRELLDVTNGAAVNSAISRLRKYGMQISARRGKGNGEWIYQAEGYAPRLMHPVVDALAYEDRELDQLVNGGGA